MSGTLRTGHNNHVTFNSDRGPVGGLLIYRILTARLRVIHLHTIFDSQIWITSLRSRSYVFRQMQYPDSIQFYSRLDMQVKNISAFHFSSSRRPFQHAAIHQSNISSSSRLCQRSTPQRTRRPLRGTTRSFLCV
jgi:hypothetical protein